MTPKVLFCDPLKCTGCKICELACSYAAEEIFKPSISRIRVISWINKGIHVPVYCQQCDPAPCLEACPTGALYRDAKTGAIKWNKDRCIGCKACVTICPFGAILYNPSEGTITKCELCDGEPACAKMCPTGAIVYEEPSRFATIKRREGALKIHELVAKIITTPPK